MPRTQSARRHNLPAHRVRLIGREQDLVAARRALLQAEGRLLSLTGTGGCGKTRLALELASSVLETFADGVWLVELGSLLDPALVPTVVVSALGLREHRGESALQMLTAWIGAREVLLLLDNCEHLIDASARLVEALLDNCPNLRVLATEAWSLSPDSLNYAASSRPLRRSATRLYHWRVRSPTL